MTTSAFVLIVLKELLNSNSIDDNNLKIGFKEEIRALEGVESVYILEQSDAPYSAVIKITTPTINILHKIVIGTISKLPMVKETKTMIVIEN